MEKIMYHCNNCKVAVDDKICPLCHSTTEPIECKNDITGYPFVKVKMNKKGLAKKMYLALEALCAFILLLINYRFSHTLSWSIVGLASISLGYIIMLIFFNSLVSSFSKISKSGCAIFVYLVFIDYFFKINTGWSVYYVLPILIIGETVMNFFFTVINHRNFQNYMIAQIVTIILAFLSISVGSNFLLTIIALFLSVLLFASTLFFGGFKGIAEMRRRFHINPEE
ncbi:MAG: hypothetical protein JJE21_02245 [Spirochaetaceae bacterium]|nr:hypothetical protein [Spirochaetaceae bacterium]